MLSNAGQRPSSKTGSPHNGGLRSTENRGKIRIAALTGLQLATELSKVVQDWPLLATVLHTGGSGALVVVMTWAVTASRTRFPTLAFTSPELSVARGPA